MTKITDKFLELQLKGEKALIAYFVVGYPTESASLLAVRGLIKGGADIIELGLPFSDPLADGPVIQNAIHIALKNHINLRRFIHFVKKIREESEVPLLVMTYSNLLFKYGFSRFLNLAKKAGIDGFILPDLPIEEASEFLKAARRYDVDAVFLVSPNTSEIRLRDIVSKSSGFLYLVSMYGTTGAQQDLKQYTIDAIQRTKKMAKRKIPVGVGFGVSRPTDVKKIIMAGADGVIVGSAFLRLVNATSNSKIETMIEDYARKLKLATKI